MDNKMDKARRPAKPVNANRQKINLDENLQRQNLQKEVPPEPETKKRKLREQQN
jgi:hypothetical protein